MELTTENIRTCPKCKSGKLEERVKRATLVKAFLFWLPIRRYRCYNCNRKSHILVKEN